MGKEEANNNNYTVEEQIAFKHARDQLVVQDNNFIQNSLMRLTPLEHKALQFLVSKIKPGDNPTQEYTFNKNVFFRSIKWGRNTSTSEVKALLEGIRNKSVWYTNDAGDQKILAWLDTVSINPATNAITVTFSRSIAPMLFSLIESYEEEGKHYSLHKYEDIALMKNKYSIRLYDLLKSYSNNKEWFFEYNTGTEHDILTKLVDPDEKGNPDIPSSLKRWASFKKYTLDVVKEEIDQYTDLNISYEGSKLDTAGNKHRNVVRIIFKISEKNEQEKKQKEERLDKIYDNIVSKEQYEQYQIYDYADKYESRKAASSFELDEKEIAKLIKKTKLPKYTVFLCKEGFELGRILEFAKHVNAIYHTIHNDNLDEDLWAIAYTQAYINRVKNMEYATLEGLDNQLENFLEYDYDGLCEKVAHDLQGNKESIIDEEDVIKDSINKYGLPEYTNYMIGEGFDLKFILKCIELMDTKFHTLDYNKMNIGLNIFAELYTKFYIEKIKNSDNPTTHGIENRLYNELASDYNGRAKIIERDNLKEKNEQSKNQFNSFEQRKYNYEELERQLLLNRKDS